jgi:H+-translocating NAD(P) transhydrogenase subunit beta
VTGTWAGMAYLLGAVCFIIALKALASPRRARVGNWIGAAGAAVALVVVFLVERPDNLLPIFVAIAVGAAIGVVAAQRVAMTAMPQMVAVFNGLGGLAGVIVASLELFAADPSTGKAQLAVAGFTVLVGAVAFSGSMVAFARLQELMTGRPLVFPGLPAIFAALLIATVAGGVWLPFGAPTWVTVALALISLTVGVLFVLPVGGADVPIVIALLNAFSGITVAAGGYVLENTLMIVAGTLVGASGALLTQLMAKAMGRSLSNILFGALAGGSTMGSTAASERPVRAATAEDIAIQLGYARRVVFAPGYGLAVAQAQHALRDLADELEGRGVEVLYAIHPVAGRMPGHMNVLLAEADVAYDKLKEMDDVNPEFRSTDVALVVGANDVVNPAARTSPGSPIFGMPILAVEEAQSVVFLKRSMRPGFAGIENELLHDTRTTLLFGDAKDSLRQLVAAVKAL